MYFVDGVYATVAATFMFAIFLLIHYFCPPKAWGDVTQSLIYHQVRKFLLRLDTRKGFSLVVADIRACQILATSNPSSRRQPALTMAVHPILQRIEERRLIYHRPHNSNERLLSLPPGNQKAKIRMARFHPRLRSESIQPSRYLALRSLGNAKSCVECWSRGSPS